MNKISLTNTDFQKLKNNECLNCKILVLYMHTLQFIEAYLYIITQDCKKVFQSLLYKAISVCFILQKHVAREKACISKINSSWLHTYLIKIVIQHPFREYVQSLYPQLSKSVLVDATNDKCSNSRCKGEKQFSQFEFVDYSYVQTQVIILNNS